MSTEQTVNTNTTDRRSFIHKVGAAGLTLGAGALLSGYASRKADAQTVQSGGIIVTAAEITKAFKTINQDEQNHVAFLSATITQLGGTPRPAPTFLEPTVNQPAPNIATFVQYSAALENTGTGAYLAATPVPSVIANPLGLQAAAEIALVEGRHAGFLNALLGRPLLTDPNQSDSAQPSPNVEVAQGPDEVYARAMPFTGVVAGDTTPGQAITTGTNLNGGPALPSTASIATADYITVLNYALFLEYLEATFYSVNVPHFFK